MSLVSDTQFQSHERAVAVIEKLSVAAENLRQVVAFAEQDTLDLIALQERIKQSSTNLLAQSVRTEPDLTKIQKINAETVDVLSNHLSAQTSRVASLNKQIEQKKDEIDEQAKQIAQLKISIANVR